MKARVLTALVLIPVVLAIITSASPLPVFVLAGLTAGLCYVELARLGGRAGFLFPVFSAIAFASAGFFAIFEPGALSISVLLALSAAGAVSAPLWVKERVRPLLETSSLWCTCPLLAVAGLHALYAPRPAIWDLKTPVLLLVIPLWIGDSLAYFVGKRFGRRLLAPEISPKKTVEGAVANLAGCLVASWFVATAISMPAWIGLVCGLLAGVFGQLGDLFESSLKRSAGLKDAGGLLPGHGGILDRIDSLLMAAPLQAVFLALVLPGKGR